jgi:YHS domain-containing protein
MIRGLLLFLGILLIYQALKTVIRSAVRAYHAEDRKRERLMGEDMVLDPQCRTYVPKNRAVTRRVGGVTCSFCSKACADEYEAAHRT